MLIVGIADRPSAESYAIVPFIVRAEDGRLLVLGHPQGEIDEEYLQGLFRISTGAIDVTSVGARLETLEPGLKAGWVGGVFMANCKAHSAPPPEVPEGCHAVKGLGRFWIGRAAELHEARLRWVETAARQAIRTRDRALAKLTRWADPHTPESEAAVWYACETEKERDRELQWFSQIVSRVGERRRTKKDIEAQIRRTIERLSQD